MGPLRLDRPRVRRSLFAASTLPPRNTEGSPIRRIGYDCWKRNIAIALGNAETSNEIVHALKSELEKNSPMVREHIEWALFQHQAA